MRKIISLLIETTLILSIFTGCSGNKSSVTETSTPQIRSSITPNPNNNIISIADSKQGNTNGNLNSFGMFADKGDWIYYSNISDGDKLYKERKDGTDKIKLNDDTSFFINIIGDWIYYNSGNVSGSQVYKIKTDGTGKTNLNFESSYLNVSGDWIYSVLRDKKLYKATTDGREFNKLCDDEVGSVAFGSIAVSGDWIYYSNMSDGGNLYKIKTDGTRRTKLNDDFSCYINVVGDWIYYCIYSINSAYESMNVYKIKTDGTGKVSINNIRGLSINVVGEWIYYSSLSDKGIYKIKTDGTNKTKLCDYSNESISVAGDWVYSGPVIGSGKYLKVKTDGTEVIMLQ